MPSGPIDAGMAAGEVLRRYPATLEVFDHHGVVFCAGCFLTLFDPLSDVAGYHAVHDSESLLDDLNRVALAPPAERPVWAQGSLPRGGLGQGAAAPGAEGVRLDIHLLDATGGRARARLDGGAAAGAPALALFAAQAADQSLGQPSAPARALRMQAVRACPEGTALVAVAEPAEVTDGLPERAYRVRVTTEAGLEVARATVSLAPRA